MKISARLQKATGITGVPSMGLTKSLAVFGPVEAFFFGFNPAIPRKNYSRRTKNSRNTSKIIASSSMLY
jgi:hypothetical protein